MPCLALWADPSLGQAAARRGLRQARDQLEAGTLLPLLAEFQVLRSSAHNTSNFDFRCGRPSRRFQAHTDSPRSRNPDGGPPHLVARTPGRAAVQPLPACVSESWSPARLGPCNAGQAWRRPGRSRQGAGRRRLSHGDIAISLDLPNPHQ
jgi:hypothetical protein